MALSEQARAARNAYRREWRKANMDKIAAQQERYWAKKAQEQGIKHDKDAATSDKL